jgi:hypothetical protein
VHPGIRFEDLQCLQVTLPQSIETDPEQPLKSVKSESVAWCMAKPGLLLAEQQDFEV